MQTEVLTTIFLQPPEEFFSSWCSSESRPSEEDATLDYDSLAASGWVLGVLPSSDVPESTFNASRVPRTSYAFQRTSLLVKVVANLTCFIPDICKGKYVNHLFAAWDYISRGWSIWVMFKNLAKIKIGRSGWKLPDPLPNLPGPTHFVTSSH